VAVDNADTTTCASGKTGETFDVNVIITPTNDEFMVTIYRGGCPGTGSLVCLDETDRYRLDASGTYVNPTDATPGQCGCTGTNQSGIRICSAWGATYYVKVERVDTPPSGNTCTNYTLTVNNGY
jgi:hypothetical protein